MDLIDALAEYLDDTHKNFRLQVRHADDNVITLLIQHIYNKVRLYFFHLHF
jgi:hypothetical protein